MNLEYDCLQRNYANVCLSGGFHLVIRSTFVYNIEGTDIISVSFIENGLTEIKTNRLVDFLLRLRRNAYVVPLCQIACYILYK